MLDIITNRLLHRMTAAIMQSMAAGIRWWR